ncbi:transporter substrate-binding domain-containing protein [Cupriavidus necator]|uniref:substrate-binding periplasmic protein n=1 Tax=Cupriavidus necator TaxID=106590 RepID=UPI00339D6CFE
MPEFPSAQALPAAGVAARRFWSIVFLTASLGLVLAWGGPRMLERAPHVPERLPAPLQDWLQRLQAEPDWSEVPVGPLLGKARRRGELVVGIRQYARPAPPGAPAPAEPDNFDAALARFLAERLNVRVRLVGLGPDAAPQAVDLIIAGTRQAGSGVPAVPTPYTGGDGVLVVLRGSASRHASDLRQRTVCVAQGSPYAADLSQRMAAQLKVYGSAIRAVSGFMAGECQALAEDGVVIARLLSLPEWRFYRQLDTTLRPDNNSPQIALRMNDAVSAAWLDRAVRQWKLSGALAQARERRAGDVAFEASQLQDGLVCHS